MVEIPSNENLKIIAKLLKGDSDELLAHVDGTEVTLNYGNKKIPMSYNSEKNLYEGIVEIEKGRKSIDGTAEFPGYFYYQSDIYIIEGTAPKPKPIPEPEPPKPEPLKPIPEPPKPKPYVMTVDVFPEIGEFLAQADIGSKNFYIIPKVNGENLLEEEIEPISLQYKTDLSGKLSEKKYIDSLDAYGWEFTPATFSGLSNFKNPQGDKKFEVELVNKEKSKVIKVSKEIKFEKIGVWAAYGKLILTIIGSLIAIILVVGFIIKKRFKKGEKILVSEKIDDFNRPETKKILKASFPTNILPYKSDDCNIEGLVFVAADKGAVGVTYESLSKQCNRASVNKVHINGDIIDKDEMKETFKKNKKGTYRLYNGDTIEFVFDNSSKKYTYTDKN